MDDNGGTCSTVAAGHEVIISALYLGNQPSRERVKLAGAAGRRAREESLGGDKPHRVENILELKVGMVA